MKTPRIKMVTTSPTDKNRVTWIPWPVAWAAARGIAKDTHHTVTLHGEYGKAVFETNPAHAGAGHVEWNEKSTKPGEVTYFDERTLVCI